MAEPTASQNPLLTISAITLFTEDLPASIAFYTTTFSAPILFRDADSCALQFRPSTVLNLLRAPEATDLVRPSPVGGPDAGRRFQLSVWVDDLDAVVARLRSAGVRLLVGPELKPWGMRVVTFEDPSGHSWEVAQKVSE